MTVQLSRDTTAIVLSRLDAFFVELLKQVTSAANPKGSRSARERVFSAPADASQDQLRREWKSYVEPELQHIFQSALETVTNDLKSLEQDKEAGRHEYVLRIPVAHIESWLNALNQARLVLAARHHFSNSELESRIPVVFSSERDIALFKIHFYGFLQEVLLQDISDAT